MREIPTGRLSNRVKAVWRINGFILTLVFGAICFGAAIGIKYLLPIENTELYFYAACAVTIILLITFVIVTPTIRYARWRFAVLEDEIDIYRGIIVRKRIIVPMIRVQYTDTTQGPLLRAFKLASVKIYTAAGAQDIEGLTTGDAEALRDKVALLAKQVQEDV